jgi:hypothetical protein
MLTNDVDLDYIRDRREEIRNFPEPGKDWYEDALDVIHGLRAVYGTQCRIFKDIEVLANMFATQPKISKDKYDLFNDVMEKTNFTILPVVSVFHPDYRVPFVQDGHTRGRLYHDAGKTYIESFILEVRKGEGLDMIERQAMMIGTYGRPVRVSSLPIEKWGFGIYD